MKAATRGWDVAAHSSSLVVAVVLAVIAGRAYGWIAFALPLGPLLVAAAAKLTGRPVPRGLQSLLGFVAVSGLMIGLGWTFTQAGNWWPPLAYVFPLALLVFTLGLLNFLMVTISRTLRAWKGQQFDYPWVPTRFLQLAGRAMTEIE